MSGIQMNARAHDASAASASSEAVQARLAADDLGATRAELRSLIAPRSVRKASGEFPRSAIMRTALSPELRWVWLGGLSLLTVLASRRVSVGRLNPWLLALTALRAAVQRKSRI